MLRHFLGSGRFFGGVGLLKVFDAKDQGATLPNERDRFYYANLITEMQRHFKSSRQPLFAYLETMATHGAYTDTYMPEVDVPGGGRGTDPEMHEYLRRLAMAQMDYAAMVLDAARLPLSDAFRARKRLMLLCNGRYSSCPAEDEVLIFHRRLLSSGV